MSSTVSLVAVSGGIEDSLTIPEDSIELDYTRAEGGAGGCGQHLLSGDAQTSPVIRLPCQVHSTATLVLVTKN